MMNNSSRRKRVKRLSGTLLCNQIQAGTVVSNVDNSGGLDENVIKNSYYYQSKYITRPCEQLFGPQTTFIDHPISPLSHIHHDLLSSNEHVVDNLDDDIEHHHHHHGNSGISTADYIPTPRWNKVQNAMLEEWYKKSRYPKANEIKIISQRFHVMDCDIEEWFRKRRGKDRRAKRRNECLKSQIDNYIQMKC